MEPTLEAQLSNLAATLMEREAQLYNLRAENMALKAKIWEMQDSMSQTTKPMTDESGKK